MKRVIKKFILCLASCGMILMMLVMPTSALSKSGDEYISFADSVTKQNEFTSLDSRIKFYETRLRAKKMSQDDIKTYAELCGAKNELINYFYELKELSVTDLRKYNYSTDQIDAIQNYDGSDEMSTRAAATVTGTLSKAEYAYNKSANKTYLKAQYTTKWNGKPYWKHDDIMAIGVAGSEARYFNSSYNFSCNKAGGNANTNIRYSLYNGAGVSVKFKIQDPVYSEVFSSATLTYRAVAGGKVTVSGVASTYLHWELGSTNAGFNITTSGANVGFTFGPAWTQENKINRTYML